MGANRPAHRARSGSRLSTHSYLEDVVGQFTYPPPLIALVAVCRHAVEQLLEKWVGPRDLGIRVVRGFVGSLELRFRKHPNLGSGCYESFYCRRVHIIVFG